MKVSSIFLNKLKIQLVLIKVDALVSNSTKENSQSSAYSITATTVSLVNDKRHIYYGVTNKPTLASEYF